MTPEITTADCLVWLPTQPEGGADLVVADSPYNIRYEYHEGSPADDRTAEEFVFWCRQWIALCYRALRPGGSLFVVISPHLGPEVGVEIVRAGFLRQEVIWYETFGSYFQTRWSYEHRNLFHAVKPPWKARTWNHEDIRIPSARQEKYGDRRADPRGRVPGSVWQFSRICGTFRERIEDVPTQLPEAMVERMVRATTNAGDTVIDPFAGSGTTAFVCQKLGRRCKTVDINPTYVAIARRRCGLDGAGMAGV